jgi:hypothetical protein
MWLLPTQFLALAFKFSFQAYKEERNVLKFTIISH